jgi:sucrose-6-phosphate hydrolase SacC (GH32 family)
LAFFGQRDCIPASALPSLFLVTVSMDNTFQTGPSRRSFLIGSAALLLPRLVWTQTKSGASLHWRLEDQDDAARELATGNKDPIASRTGHAIWVGNGRERALRLDGYSVWVDHANSPLHIDSAPLTICAWIALESYPVKEAALLDSGCFRLAIDQWGYLLLAVRSGETWTRCLSNHAIPRGKWVHVAGTASGRNELALFCDGAVCGSSVSSITAPKPESGERVILGKSSDSPLVANVFATGVLNCLLRDMRVYQEALSPALLLDISNEARPEQEPDLAINGNWCGSDLQRPQYHAMPPRAWTNEPHGLVFFKSQYHLFYQKNANGPYWGNINWGHMTSPDLHEWTEQPVALSPQQGLDEAGCWSGSVIEHEGKLAIIYTSGDGQRATISLAQSDDGINFEKFNGNPIIEAPPQGRGFPEFRDPFVWREGSSYYLIAGSAVKGIGGTALLYRSEDLIHWDFKRPLLVGDRERSGVFWEMPVFLKIGEMHVLIVCEVPGRASYWVGTWKDEVFTPVSHEPRRLDLFNHLLSPTPHVTSAGEVITIGIVPDQRSPKECWRAGWAHLYSLPRQLSLDPHGGLEQRPWKGAAAKWMSEPVTYSNVTLREGVPNLLSGASGKCLHLRVVFKKEMSRSIEIILRRSPDGRERTVLRYEWEIGRLVLDRTSSSVDPEVKRDLQEGTYFPLQDGVIDFEIYLDVSVLEVFVDQRAAFASRIYPLLEESIGLAMRCEGGDAELEAVTISRPLKHEANKQV